MLKLKRKRYVKISKGLFIIIGILFLCAACDLIEAKNNISNPSPISRNTLSRVLALGKLVPEGDVIKISVINARDSRVNQLLVKEGDFVKANQAIAILQGRDRVEQQLRDVRADVAIKRAQLLKIKQGDVKQAEITAQRATIGELEARIKTETKVKQAAIAQATATIRNAQLKFERYSDLEKQGAIKRSEFDDAREEFEKATATLAQAIAELDYTTSTLTAQLAKENANLKRLQEVRPVDIEIASRELEQAQIRVEQQKAVLDDTLVRVPIAGQILRINTRVGEQVNQDAGIAELGRTNQMFVTAEIYETDIVKIRPGQKVTIKSEYGGFTGEIYGAVDRIGLQIGKSRLNQDQYNPTTDINARVVEVAIRLNPEDSKKVAALTGMQVRVKIDVSS
ncbi:HlyD family efflux transporter periplasmic adaptor subunit [Nostoc sp. FACHB-892]|uniref:HlyD family efflux transporter periplasmic adaptor subunit n=1 Tax=Nostoc sp. FACHB-892 TaxID=2692843 RepID=UPI0016882507|nr:HlyD family efflux transporter periplasmic adaptor subunit [Nostoc sp. FACHB-892]MBD2730147.1 HlyD family efflux transporter periplasmic adaptor subunit [Nostoc sp. FACHB-892]